MRLHPRAKTLAAGALAVSVLLIACGASGGPGSDEDAPPPVTIRFFDRSLELNAWTYCFGGTCADGYRPAAPPNVGNPEEILVEFSLPGWSFAATFTPAGEQCGRQQRVPLEAIDERRFVLRPAGRADTYDVDLFAVGGGDLIVTFRWTTPRDGPLPEPRARLAVLAEHDGTVDSYGVELEVTNLATTPELATASITVRAGTGEAITFEATRAKGRCRPEGSVYWDGPDRQGLAAAALGEGPFEYEVELVLDGATYRATASWPEDEIRRNEPSVSLRFRPVLPALG